MTKTYDETFKRDAVALLESGRPLKKLAAELGVCAGSLRGWRERFSKNATSKEQPQTLELAQMEVRRLRQEVADLRLQREILKKNAGHPCRSAAQRCQRVRDMSQQYSVSLLCRVLDVSRSGYYAWLRQDHGPRAQETARLDQVIEETFIDNRRAYGSPRVAVALRALGWKCGENRVAKRMRALNIQARKRRRFVPRTTQSDPHCPVAPTAWQSGPRPRESTKPGSQTSPICHWLEAALSILPRSWTVLAAASSAGLWAPLWSAV
jgi:putative transposase